MNIGLRVHDNRGIKCSIISLLQNKHKVIILKSYKGITQKSFDRFRKHAIIISVWNKQLSKRLIKI